MARFICSKLLQTYFCEDYNFVSSFNYDYNFFKSTIYTCKNLISSISAYWVLKLHYISRLCVQYNIWEHIGNWPPSHSRRLLVLLRATCAACSVQSGLISAFWRYDSKPMIYTFWYLFRLPLILGIVSLSLKKAQGWPSTPLLEHLYFIPWIICIPTACYKLWRRLIIKTQGSKSVRVGVIFFVDILMVLLQRKRIKCRTYLSPSAMERSPNLNALWVISSCHVRDSIK